MSDYEIWTPSDGSGCLLGRNMEYATADPKVYANLFARYIRRKQYSECFNRNYVDPATAPWTAVRRLVFVCVTDLISALARAWILSATNASGV